MSGIEIAGTVLAVIPLFIQAIEYYKSSASVFARYKNYDKDLQRLAEDLACERGILHAELEILLETVTTWDKVEIQKQLNLGNSSERLKTDVNARLIHYLGSSGIQVYLAIKRINEQLQFFDSKIETLGSTINKSPQYTKEDGASKRAWFSRIKSRLDFSFSSQEFEKQLSDLKEHNRTLDFILRLVEEGHKRKSRIPFKPEPQPVERKLAHIRNATSRIYNCLSHACNTHRRHIVYFDLGDFQTKGQNPLSEGIDLALHVCPQLDLNNGLIEPPFRFSVSSTSSDQTKVNFAIQEEKEEHQPPAPILKRKRNSDLQSIDKHTEGKRERRQKDNYERCTLGVQNLNLGKDTHCSSQEIPKEWDFSELGDFCDRIQSRSQHLARVGHTSSLGYLNMGHDTELQVYPPRRPAPCKYPQSLSKFFAGSKGRLLPHEIPHLAKRVASAILFSHASSLLSDDWARESIVFFEIDEGRPWYRQPQLKVDLRNKENVPSIKKTAATMIRNPYIFSLGCLLIELAYGVPLNDLRNHSDEIIDGEDGPNTRYCIALRVSLSIAAKLGDKYMEVVRKCIQCDFGRGEDLEKPALQKEFHKEVISVLGDMEREELAKMSALAESDSDWC